MAVRRSKETDSLSIMDQNDSGFIFCGNWHCLQFDCLRHHSHEPFNTMVKERKWEPKNDKNCEGKITDGN